MKKYLSSIPLIVTLILFAGKSYCQQKPDTINLSLSTFYRQALHIDSAKAERVASIQDKYKAAMKVVLSDPGFSKQEKEKKIKSLMTGRSKSMEAILTREQLEKLIPISEQEPSEPDKKNHH